MSDEIMRALLRKSAESPAAARYDKGLFSSYVRRAEDTLGFAVAMKTRSDPRQRAYAAEGLTRATEQVCKALRVANGQTATRSRDVRELLDGNGTTIEPLSDEVWRSRLAQLVTLVESAACTDEELEVWTARLTGFLRDIASVQPPPRRPARASRFTPPAASLSPPARVDPSTRRR